MFQNAFLKRCFAFILLVSTLLSFAACAKSEEVVTSNETIEILDPVETLPQETVTEVETEEPVVVKKDLNPLTGLECDPSLVGKRPIAIMIGNTKDALPQYGLSQLDIIYEVLAEGGILRLEGVVHDYHSVTKIGSVRSARAYYAEIASAYDAIYVHSGINVFAVSHVANLGLNNINATGDAFYRDQERRNAGYASEHTHFVDGSKLAGTIENLKYRTDLKNETFSAFNFDSEFSSLGTGKSAKYIKIPHSGYNVSEFNYNEADQKYYHVQYGDKHIDAANGEQVATDNVFVLFAKHGYFPDNKSRNITLIGEGKGYYMTGGEVVSITWKRSEVNGAFSYFKEDGSELSVRPGKSYVSIADANIANSVTIS